MIAVLRNTGSNDKIVYTGVVRTEELQYTYSNLPIKLSGDGQSKENVHRSKGWKSECSTLKCISLTSIGKMPSVKGLKGRLLTSLLCMD